MTSRRITFAGGSILPTAQVTSVEPVPEPAFNKGVFVAPPLVLIGIYFVLRAVVGEGHIGGYQVTLSWILGVGALVVGGLAVPIGRQLAGTRYWVLVTSGGTTTKAVGSPDKSWTERVVLSISEAIASRR